MMSTNLHQDKALAYHINDIFKLFSCLLYRPGLVIGIPCVNISYSMMTAANIVITRGEYYNYTARGWISIYVFF